MKYKNVKISLCSDNRLSEKQPKSKNEYGWFNTTITTTITTEFLVPRGGRKSSIPAINHDTLRDGRKGDTQHKCCGKEIQKALQIAHKS